MSPLFQPSALADRQIVGRSCVVQVEAAMKAKKGRRRDQYKGYQDPRVQLKQYNELRQRMARFNRDRMRLEKDEDDPIMQNIPVLDTKNREVVVFFQTEKKPMWRPMTIMKGGVQMNTLVAGVENAPIGVSNLKKNLRNAVAEAIYRDEQSMIDNLREQDEANLKYSDKFQWAFKVRSNKEEDKKDTFKVENLYIIPEKDKVPKGAVETVKELGSNFTKSVRSGIDNITGN